MNRKIRKLRKSKYYWLGTAEISEIYVNLKKQKVSDREFARLYYFHRPYLIYKNYKYAKWRETKAYELACQDFLDWLDIKEILPIWLSAYRIKLAKDLNKW